jgi:hypothetical protein
VVLSTHSIKFLAGIVAIIVQPFGASARMKSAWIFVSANRSGSLRTLDVAVAALHNCHLVRRRPKPQNGRT